MPTICIFWGIIIRMHYAEVGSKHNMPHFHAVYAGKEAVFDFEGEVLAGAFPPKQTAYVKAWALRHAEELSTNWQLLANGEEPFRLEPLR